MIHDRDPNQARQARARLERKQWLLHKKVCMAAHFLVHCFLLYRTPCVAAHHFLERTMWYELEPLIPFTFEMEPDQRRGGMITSPVDVALLFQSSAFLHMKALWYMDSLGLF